MKCLEDAIKAARALAEKLENEMPFSLHDTPAEDAGHEMIHALNDAADIAERALQTTK